MTIDFAKLTEPFPANDIEWRAGATNPEKTKALALAYTTSRAIMNRLDAVAGPANWRDEYASGPDGGVLCGLSLRIDDEWITKWDGADNSDIEAVKGGLTDAFKRVAVKWGIGRYLYNLDGVWVECTVRGKTVVLSKKPTLPAWALPKPAPRTTAPTNGKPTPPPAPERLPVPTFVMSREEAEAETASDGTPYGQIDSAELENRQHGITKGLKQEGLTIEQKEIYKRKSMAISVILEAREAEDAAASVEMNVGA